jgi:hypothetical protein
MMARLHSPAFSLLTDFDRASGEELPDFDTQLKAAFEEGYQRGLTDGRAEAEADCEMRLAEATTRHAEELAHEKQNWELTCADVLFARLESAAKLIEQSIEERVSDLLRPWLLERLRVRALQDLEKAISRSLSEGAKVHIEAPGEILEHLRAHLPSESFQIGYSESPTSDVRAHIDDTRIEANLSAWIAELEAITS